MLDKTKFKENFITLIKNIQENEKNSTYLDPEYLYDLVYKELVNKNEDLKKWNFIFEEAKLIKNKKLITLSENEINSKKLKIIFVTGVFPGTDHGGGLRVFDMINELYLRGHEVYLFSSNMNYLENKSNELLKKYCKNIKIVSVEEFTSIKFNNWINTSGHFFDIGYIIWPWSVNIIENIKNIDKIVFEYIECTTRRIWLDIILHYRDKKNKLLKQSLYELLTHYYCESSAAKKSDILISLTEKDSIFIKKIFGKDSYIIPTGISRNEFYENNKINDTASIIFPSACFIGNYLHYPNMDGLNWYLKNIHGKIIDQIPSYIFAIIGIGNELGINELKIKYSNYADSLVWVGEVDDVASAIYPYTICLAPLINGAGLRGKIIQYAFLEKPIVSTEIGACGTNYVHNESILLSNDIDSFVDNVIILLKDNALRNKIKSNAYEITNKYSNWFQSISSLEKIFNK